MLKKWHQLYVFLEYLLKINFVEIDEFLIKRCFQPVCNSSGRVLGWSRGVLIAVSSIIASIGLTPLMAVTFIAGMYINMLFFLLASFMLLWIGIQAYYVFSLLRNDFKTEEATRFTEQLVRKHMLILSLLVLPFALIALAYDGMAVITASYLAGGIANICASYFKACTDTNVDISEPQRTIPQEA